jgi:tight adherence protein B
VRPRRTSRVGLVAAVLATVAFAFAPAALAQSEASLLTIRSVDATDSKNVQLTFLYTGRPGNLENLTVREDGKAVTSVKVDDFRKSDKRIGTVVLIDLSGSMNDDGALSFAKQSVTSIAKSLPAGDQMAVIGFSNEVTVESSFTDDVGQLTSALDGMAAPRDGRTAMWDAIRKGVSLLDSRPQLQPNLLLVTDGSDDVSRATLADARASVVDSGAAFFALELTHKKGEVAAKDISSIIDRTGGAAFSGTTQKEVDDSFDKVMTTMRSQYIASYTSNARQGSVNVTLSLGSVEKSASYVAGSRAEGGKLAVTKPADKAFGPSWMRSTTGALLALLCVGAGVGLGVFAIINLAGSKSEGLSAVLSPYTEGAPADAGNDNQLAQTAFLQRAVEMTEDFAERRGFLQKVENALERADIPLRAAEALFFYVAGVLVLSLMAIFGLGLVPGLILAIIVAMAPPAVVSFMANRRRKKFVGQLPDTLSLLSGSLRAGYSLMQGVEAVSQEVSEPMGKELRRVITEARLGREIEQALDGVAERMESPDFGWAVMAIRIQREVGGNLAELLMTVSETMVQRDRLRRDVAALTAEGRISAIILGLLPVGLGIFMYLANKEYMEPLFNTGIGQALLATSVVSILIGFAWMKKTITIEI